MPEEIRENQPQESMNSGLGFGSPGEIQAQMGSSLKAERNASLPILARSGHDLVFVFFQYFPFFFSSYLSDNVNVVFKS
jgi:hypothetical protein